MSATERLRQLLDNRGIEHEDADTEIDGKAYGAVTRWEYGDVFAQHSEKFGVGTLLMACDLTPEQAIDATVGIEITEDTSDGWHSFKDLYHHRALLFSVIVHNYRDMCWKSKKHHDGKKLDWNFIVGIDTPWGQASYHYGMEYWDIFDCKEVEQAPYYDGYTADESVERIARLVELGAPETCKLELSTDMTYVRCDQCGLRIPRGTDLTKTRYCGGCGRRVVS